MSQLRYRKTLSIENKDWLTRLRKHKWVLALAFFFLMFAGVATALYMRPDPQVARVNALGEQMIAKAKKDFKSWVGQSVGADGRVSKEQVARIKNWSKLKDQYRQERDKLTPEQREQSDAQAREQKKQVFQFFMSVFEQKLDHYFALPESKKTAYLDQKIREFDAQRRVWKQIRGKRGDDNKRDDRRRDPQTREERHRYFMNMTTPEFRAKATKFFDDMKARRKELGMPVRSGRKPW